MKSHRRYFRVDRRQIAFFRFVLEACDGLAMLRTIDARQGTVMVYIARGCREEADALLADLSRSIRMEPIPPVADQLLAGPDAPTNPNTA